MPQAGAIIIRIYTEDDDIAAEAAAATAARRQRQQRHRELRDARMEADRAHAGFPEGDWAVHASIWGPSTPSPSQAAVVAQYKKAFADAGGDKTAVCAALELDEAMWVDGSEAAFLTQYLGVPA